MLALGLGELEILLVVGSGVNEAVWVHRKDHSWGSVSYCFSLLQLSKTDHGA